MKSNNIQLHELVADNDPQAIFEEIDQTVSLINPDFDHDFLARVHSDIVRLFNGKFPGYQASNTEYHDLEHTCLVALASARLIHGLWVKGEKFSPRDILLGLIAAYFHDTGLIQTTDDTHGSGAKYTVGHEQRSIRLMQNYLEPNNMDQQAIADCTHIIQATILQLSIKEIPFRNPTQKLMGQILGSADLLAQMADRYYLEKLPLLFNEMQEGGKNDFESEMELLKKTEAFYSQVAQTRLKKEMGDIAPAMGLHFKARWGLEQDLYAESIARNIDYLVTVNQKCHDQGECYMQYLRRGDILKKFFRQ